MGLRVVNLRRVAVLANLTHDRQRRLAGWRLGPAFTRGSHSVAQRGLRCIKHLHVTPSLLDIAQPLSVHEE
jgi:hypothetical protein